MLERVAKTKKTTPLTLRECAEEQLNTLNDGYSPEEVAAWNAEQQAYGGYEAAEAAGAVERALSRERYRNPLGGFEKVEGRRYVIREILVLTSSVEHTSAISRHETRCFL